VASTYCNSWIFDQLDPKDPFESMGRAYTELFIVRDEAFKENTYATALKNLNLMGSYFTMPRPAPTTQTTDMACQSV
jgi:hypothetical protein